MEKWQENLRKEVDAVDINNIKRFAQSRVKGCKATWIEYKDGTRHESTGDIIGIIFHRWAESPKAIRHNEGDWTVFDFKQQ